LIGSRKLSYFL